MSMVVAEAAPAPPGASAQDGDIRYFRQILENPANDFATRVGAAERLLRIGAPAAMDVLDTALRSGAGDRMRPVLQAAQTVDVGDRMADVAVEAAATAPDEVMDLLADVVAATSTQVPPPILAAARDRSVPLRHRLNAIRVLGAFTSIEAGDALIDLADPGRGDDDRIPTAALENLRRLTSLDLGDDYDRWRTFWAQARNSSPAAWALVQRYQARITTLEERTGQLATDYVALLREHYRVLTVDDQLARLPGDLAHTLDLVRGFAVERIARLLRDSYRIPEDLQAQLMVVLDDPEPALRAHAARLLDELDEPKLGLRLAARLASEADTEVRTAYFQVLADRPTVEALPAILDDLRDEALTEPAAAALWGLLFDNLLGPEELDHVRTTVFAALAETPDPAIVRIATLVAPEPELRTLIALLEGDDDALCAAVAEALVARGLEQPLLQAASHDERVRVWAIRVVAAGRANAERFERLVELAPSPTDVELVEEWRESVRLLAGELADEDVLAATNRLDGVPAADDGLRAVVLTRAAMLPRGTLTSDERVEVLVRVMPLLLKLGEAQRAIELVESSNGTFDARLERLHLQAVLLTGQFTDPLAITAPLDARIDAFIASIDVDPSGAKRIAEQLELDLEAEIQPELRREFETGLTRLEARLANADGDDGDDGR